MNFISLLFKEFIIHPKSLLFLVAAINAFWVIYIVFIKKNYKKKIFKVYFIYTFFIFLWVLSNAYFHSGLLTFLDGKFAKYAAIFSNIVVAFAGLAFYYLSQFVRNGFVSRRIIIFIASFALFTLFFNLWPNLTVKDVVIFSDGSFKLILSQWNGLFFLSGMLLIILSCFNFIAAIRLNTQKIANARIFYILFGMSLLYGSVLLFTIIFPAVFNTFDYVWIPPFMSMAEILLIGYAIFTKRFLDIRLIISNFLKLFLSFGIAFGAGYYIYYFLEAVLPFFSLHIVSSFVFLVLYLKIRTFLNSHNFQRRFGLTDTEFIRQISAKVKSKNKVYISIKELENDLKKLFRRGSKNFDCQIIMLNKKEKAKYPKLIEYLSVHKEILITEEIKVIEGEEDRIFPFIEELECLGGLCVPLLSPSKDLAGLFALKKKSYGHLYTQNEIDALEQLGVYISLLVTEILYSSQLKKEVQNKTLELRQQIKEKNELVHQQSDFMAVTAHEFRTPLSIAIFQLEEILKKSQDNSEITQDLSVIESSLSNLKKLTQKLFAIQQYDLKKVKIHKEKVDLKIFINNLYNDFLPIVKEKKLEFKLEDQLKGKTVLNIDAPQILQVLHNLLSNACKFTDDGEITLGIKQTKNNVLIYVKDTGRGIPNHLKKSVFNKFRTNSAESGIGLGLYICQKIIELHHGKIWVEDTAGGGSTFFIQLRSDALF